MGPLNNNNVNRTKTLSLLTLPKLLQIASVLITVFGTPEMLLYTIVPDRMPNICLSSIKVNRHLLCPGVGIHIWRYFYLGGISFK